MSSDPLTQARDRIAELEADNAALREAVRVLVKGIDAADLMASQTTGEGRAYPTIGEYIPEYAQARSEIDANPLAAASIREVKEPTSVYVKCQTCGAVWDTAYPQTKAMIGCRCQSKPVVITKAEFDSKFDAAKEVP